MSVKVYKHVNIDFYNPKYIVIESKQCDLKSRFICFHCTNSSENVKLNSDDHTVFVRCRKPDGYGIFNKCEIDDDGNIIVELTEQILFAEGMVYADLLVVDGSGYNLDDESHIINENGEIVYNASIISTMGFYINVLPKPITDEEIESTDDFSALNDLLIKATADYEQIITITKEYKDDALESKNLAEQYANTASQKADDAATSEQNAQQYANDAKDSELNAKISEQNAKQSELNSKQSELNAKTSEDNASASATSANNSANDSKNYSDLSKSYAVGEGNVRQNESADNAKYYCQQANAHATSASNSASDSADILSDIQSIQTDINNTASQVATDAQNASTSASNAVTSAQNASISETNAQTYAQNAKNSEDNAKAYADSIGSKVADAEEAAENAEQSYQNVLNYDIQSANYAKQAKSYAVGGTDFRQDEDTDNAAYYYEQVRNIATGIAGGLYPMGTVVFAVLENQGKKAGYMYNISDEFVSTDNFKDGGGITYPVGTNVYWTADGKWDCLAGNFVAGVKGDAEQTYRKGNVNITPANIGTYSKTEIDNLISILQDTISDLTDRIVELEKLNGVTLLALNEND